MKVDVYERVWMWLAAIMIFGFLTAVIVGAARSAVHPPSHIETIDPTKVRVEGDFVTPRIETQPDGTTLIVGTAELFAFKPAVMRVPVGKPVTFRLTSPDVVHGFQIVGTNVNATLMPGYVSQMTVTFPKAGEYLLVCNEYCGLAHHLMQGKLIVEEAR